MLLIIQENRAMVYPDTIELDMKVLAIESSCDETAAAVVEDGTRLLSNVINSQIDIHSVYGGVVPEVAARSHLEVIMPVIDKALSDAFGPSSGNGGQSSVDSTQSGQKMTAENSSLKTFDPWDHIDAIAVTYAPGLVGSLLIGSLAARTLALLKNKPLYPIHHVEGHVYANFIVEDDKNANGRWKIEDGESQRTDSSASSANSHIPIANSHTPQFPILALIVSGGHSQLVLFRDHGDYELLGQTQDDAVGEAFDKVARIIGLPYPGGPSIATAALEGNSTTFNLPKAKLKCPVGCTHHSAAIGRWKVEGGESQRTDSSVSSANSHIPIANSQNCRKYSFSFSGLKTAVLRTVQVQVGVAYDFPSHQLPEKVSERLRADVAASFQRVAVETLVDKTISAFEAHSPASVVIAGGVAANQELRRQLRERLPIAIQYAPISLCTDNAAMIASLAYYYAQVNQPTDPRDLEVVPSLSMTKTAWAKRELA